jgi:pre-rRNA-processing protein IPI3
MNLRFFPVSGFQSEAPKLMRLEAVVKPKFGAFQDSGSGSGTVPGNYAINAQLLGSTPEQSESMFSQALFGKSFPTSLLDEGLSELAAWSEGPPPEAKAKDVSQLEDFMSLDGPAPKQPDSQQQSAEHKSELDALRRVNKAAFQKIQKLQAQLLEQQNKAQADDEGSSDEDEEMSSDDSE